MDLSGGGRRAGDVARAVSGRLHGDPERRLRGVRTLEEAGPEHLTFLANPRYRDALRRSGAGVVLCRTADAVPGRDWIEVDDPYYALALVLPLFYPAAPSAGGIDPRAALGRDVALGRGVAIGPFAAVGDGCRLADGVALGAGVVLGDGVTVGEGSVLHPRVVVYAGCRLGARVVVHAATVIGADGFGYATRGGVHHKVLQVGDVVIEDDVEIGAGCTIDRAALGSTVIGAGTKIDDQVMIAHNVVIGPGSILVAQSGVAGSARLGRGVVLAGQSGIAGHLTVGDGARVAAKSALLQDLEAGVTAAGIPAIPISAWRRAQAVWSRLPEVLRRLRRLERGRGAGRGEA
jgi:UDP-3-O-[3-hydroxymyristoyl] glucosamine N-acyltransferase